MFLSLIMDGFVALLLLITIVYVVKLNSKLAVLRQDRDHLGETVKALQNASRQAEEAVLGLKLTASEAGQGLQNAIDKAKLAKGDLNFLIEKAETVADRLEHALKVQREAPPRAGEVRVRPATATAKPQHERTHDPKGEGKLAAGRLSRFLRHADGDERSKRVEPAADAHPVAAALDEDEPAPMSIRSRAERDLQRALEARR